MGYNLQLAPDILCKELLLVVCYGRRAAREK
jgi:hypothetical protein